MTINVVPDMTDDLKKQADYVKKQKLKNNAGMGLVFAEAFLRGMRDLGYKSPGTALDELVDNSNPVCDLVHNSVHSRVCDLVRYLVYDSSCSSVCDLVESF